MYRRTSQGALVSPDDGSIASLSLTEMLLLLLLCGALGSRNDLLGRALSELCHVTIPEVKSLRQDRRSHTDLTKNQRSRHLHTPLPLTAKQDKTGRRSECSIPLFAPLSWPRFSARLPLLAP
ncbi:hypothetical protein C8Q69DRAFT_137826 [Paecilomyces variotii]|uniref:Uncharacterized protein n=1 Tax=Byssochlamys spectabilis TaxID=264951 RepID=A0A443I086_BYSSP|nr:hypothetical protein C8Q69DRAFT_137826 [Paecilomyces variotii]RWQ97476.1 hypothetical protein C8Q69DRAFT_137826 [Paecilomyces variotii]